MIATLLLHLVAQQSEAMPADLTKGERFAWTLFRDDFAAFERASRDLGANPTELVHGRYTPLSYASSSGKLRHVEFLLSIGASVDGRNRDGSTALMCAARDHFDLQGTSAVIERLVAAGAALDAQDDKGASAMHYAASWPVYDFHWQGQEDAYARTLDFLAHKGASVDLRDKDGMTPLLYAARSGHKESFDELVRLGADARAVDKLNRSALTFVAGDFDGSPIKKAVLELGLPKGPMEHLLEGDEDAALAMLRGGTEKLSYGPWRESPLKLAALTGRLDVVEAVLRYETEVNAVDDFGETALHAAVGLSTSHDLLATRRLGEGDHVGMIGALVRAGADPNIAVASDRARFDEEDETPLYRAVGAGRVETVQALLKAGAKVDGSGSKRPLELACTLHRLDLVKILLEHGADARLGFPVREVYEGYAGVWPGAAKGNEAAILRLLVERGSALAFPTKYAVPDDLKYREHALHLVATDLECLRIVLAVSKEVNEKNSVGETPLIVATKAGAATCVSELLRHGADRSLTDARGRTPLDIAKADGNAEIVRILGG